MTMFDLEDTSIYYEVVGDGPPLLVCHGGPGLHHGPYRSLDRLGDRHRLVFWDHRGHGRSGRPDASTLTMPRFADDAAALATHLGIERAVAFGHSFGGWVAQELALRHPHLVAALVLVATTPGQLGASESETDDQGPPPPPEVLELLTTPPQTDADVVAQYRALAPHFARRVDPVLITDHLDERLADARSMNAVFTALAAWSSVDRLATISCPALVVGGREDVFCSPPQTERIGRRIPGADVVVFGDCGHFVWAERGHDFFPLVQRWLANRVAI